MSHVRFRLLGPLDAERDGVTLELGARKQRAVLALLLLDANRIVSTERLIDGLWGTRRRRRPAPRCRCTSPACARRSERTVRHFARARRDTSSTFRPEAATSTSSPRCGPREAAGGACALAACAGRPGRRRAVRRSGRPARGDPPGRARGADRGRPRQGRHAEVVPEPRRARGGASLPRALPGAADARPLPLGARPTRSRRTARRARRSWTSSGSSRGGAEKARAVDARPRSGAWLRAAPPAAAAPGRRKRRVGVVAAALLVVAGLAAAPSSCSEARRLRRGRAELRRGHRSGVERCVGQVPAGNRPEAIAAGGGSVYAANLDGKSLTRIDPATREGRRHHPPRGKTPTGIAFGHGHLWAAHGLTGQVTRIDPELGGQETFDVAETPLARRRRRDRAERRVGRLPDGTMAASTRRRARRRAT